MIEDNNVKKGSFWRFIISAVIILGTLWFLQRLVTPKYVDDVIEGALIAEYYEDAHNHDVVFIGDCEVYENFSPQILYDEYGINSYIRGSAQQLIWQSYYLLEDTLKYETPDVVVFNVLSMKYDTPQHEAYNRMTLEGMRWSSSKVKSIQASMMEGESFLDYVFPVLRYHSRVPEIGKSDFEYLFKTKPVSHNGYYLRVDVKPAENVPEGDILADYNFGANSYKYLDMMTALCKEKGVKLVLVKAPSLYPYWYPEWEEQMEKYAADNGLDYINYLDLIDETGLDFSTDTYDGGLHLNLAGAEKITRHFGNYLRDEVGLKDRRGEEPLASFWDEKRRLYEADIEGQYAALQQKMLEENSNKSVSSDKVNDSSVEIAQIADEDHKGYWFKTGDIAIGIDEPSDGIIAALGEPMSYYEAPSCAFEGLDKIYTYKSFVVETYSNEAGDTLISSISLKDDSVTTKEGAMIGSTKEQVLKLYGEPATKEDVRFIYLKDNMRLTFIFREGGAALIEYHTTALDK